MNLSVTHVFLIVIFFFLVGYWWQKKKVKRLKDKIRAAEDAMLRTDKDYLAVLKENEALKDEIIKQQDEEVRIISLHELFKGKKN
jgi:hypothetical protein